MTLVEVMEKAAVGSYGEESELIGKLAGIIHAAKVESGSWGPFICGTMGKVGPDGLHDGYLICPAFGADANCTAHFKRA
jgi:hypothetical protein